MRRQPSIDSLLRRCEPEPNTGCWLWTAHVSAKGYGYTGGGTAHRAMYEATRGAIPAGLQIDHLCRVRCCVNPDHLEAVTPRENTLRGKSPAAQQARQTHCIHGHEFTPENTWVSASGKRQCRSCWHRSPRSEQSRARSAAYMREWSARNKEWRSEYNRLYRQRRKGAA